MAKKKLDMTIPTVVFVTLTIGSLLVTLHYSSEHARLTAKAEGLDIERTLIEGQQADLLEESTRLRAILTGRDRRGQPFSSNDEGEWKKVFKDQIDDVPGFKMILNDETLPPNVIAALGGTNPYEGLEYSYGEYEDLRQMNHLLTVEAAHLLFQVRQADLVVEGVTELGDKLEAQRVETQQRLKSLREEIQTQADNWTARIGSETRDLDNRISDLRKDIEAEKRDIRRAERDNQRALSSLKTALSFKADSIRVLIERELTTIADLEPQGRIDHSDLVLGKVWIDLGSRHGLRLGQRFEVFAFARGGRRHIKGLIEVQRMDESQAQCIIIPGVRMRDYETGQWHTLPEEYEPIVQGDLVRTPFYSPSRRPVFVFVGEDFKNPLYRTATDGIDKIDRMIRRAGGILENQVSARTDFVITRLKPENDDGYQRAAQFGITFIDEDDIYKFIEP